jgi:hypothetical protein
MTSAHAEFPKGIGLRRVAHPPSPRYAATNVSIEKTVPRDSM